MDNGKVHTTFFSHHSGCIDAGLRCDDIDIFTSQPKGLAKTVSTYSHAQKMRAAISHVFGRTFGQGNTSWIEIQSGRFVGNPSLSTVVCQYMVSLRRRKVLHFFRYSINIY